jgi:hypothetical protein
MGLGVAGFAVGDIGLSMPQLLKMRSLYKAGTRFNELAELARQGKANSERLKALERILGNMDQKKVDMLAHLAAKKESMSGLRLVVADAIKDGKIKVSSEEALSALVTRLADDAVESKMSKQALDDLMLKVDANLKSNPAFKNKMAQLSACSVEADPCKCISQKGL